MAWILSALISWAPLKERVVLKTTLVLSKESIDGRKFRNGAGRISLMSFYLVCVIKPKNHDPGHKSARADMNKAWPKKVGVSSKSSFRIGLV